MWPCWRRFTGRTYVFGDTAIPARRLGRRGIIPRMTTGPVPLTESKILRAFAEKTPGSRVLHNRAKALFPDGITHVGRFLDPFPIYVERASGSRTWDVDGNDYVDCLGGHG